MPLLRVESIISSGVKQKLHYARHFSSTISPGISEEFVNRNPRNLEQMLLERKPDGYSLDYPSRKFWNKVALVVSGRQVQGRVTHYTGKVVVSAASSEDAIRKYLPSLKDVNAVEAVARVLARRCFETGISQVHHELIPGEDVSQKLSVFLKTLESEGLQLKELEEIQPLKRSDI